ncbi:MAG: aminotransferase class IV family protein [Bryobacteraceae bacterium]|nr:aminotransferase class IV family protein [Bryobacteraceae bacterium]
MLHRFVLHNDEIREASDPVFSIGQVGTLMGWGVFSTFRIARGTLFAFERHWARMKRDAELLRVPFPSDPEWLRERLLLLIEANRCPEATMRVCIVKNRGTVFVGPDISREFDMVAMTTNLANWGKSVRLGVVPNGRFAASPYSRTKVLSWAFNLNWYQSAHERGFDEVVLLNEREEVAECTSANLFAVYGDQVCTPPLESGCLPGITREILLSEIHEPGIRVVERKLTLPQLEDADELFITSSTRELLPVSEIEGIQVKGATQITSRLKRAFQTYTEDYACPKAIA